MTYPSSPGNPPPYTAPHSSMAIVSLVAGILGLTFVPVIGSIVAVITGPMAKSEIRASGGALGGEGLATAGAVLGWVGIGLGVLGLCIAGAVITIPICLVALGLSANGSQLLLPTLLSLF